MAITRDWLTYEDLKAEASELTGRPVTVGQLRRAVQYLRMERGVPLDRDVAFRRSGKADPLSTRRLLESVILELSPEMADQGGDHDASDGAGLAGDPGRRGGGAAVAGQPVR